MSTERKKSIVYIDGFNLYFGMKSKGLKQCFWLDVRKLAEQIIDSECDLIEVKYFTSRITGNPDKELRQSTYLDALATLPGVSFYFGQYIKKIHTCSKCHRQDDIHNEKMTDVKIAIELLSDALTDRFDVAYIISGDSDLSPAISKVRELSPSKAIHCRFPPNRHSKVLSRSANSGRMLYEVILSRSQFPDTVRSQVGFVLKRPISWNKLDGIPDNPIT